MLIDFTVGNFLSIKDKITLSMLASGIKEHSTTNVFDSGKHKLLKSAAIYGANASGKSNLIKAMIFMRNYIIESAKNKQSGEDIKVIPFLLNSETQKSKSSFEIIIQIKDITYRYGFEIDNKKVHSEWLFQTQKSREIQLFTRELQKIEISEYFKEGKLLGDKTRENALFLSVVAQFNGKIAISILKWFFNLNVMSGLDDIGFMSFTLEQFANVVEKEKIENLLKIFDLGFENLKLLKIPINNHEKTEILPYGAYHGNLIKGSTSELVDVLATHSVFNENNKIIKQIDFPLSLLESDGTQKIISLSGPLIAIFENTSVVVIDELDSRLHPILTKKIIELFHSEINKYNSQLIFATHDTNLLDKDMMRRDQIWFTEKDAYGATDLYSLVEFNMDNGKKVRNDASYEKDYILGKYGAIPYIGEFTNLSEMEK